jgi:23S rRNA (cytidine1920-2'-O)/16S rRNA (cytidine1409-2'-O)-methyltransferase
MMVKPQFEVGKDRLGSGGVVRSPELRAETVRGVAGRAYELGLGVKGVTASPLPGPSGNVEYFLWLSAGAPELDPADVDRAVAEGPR